MAVPCSVMISAVGAQIDDSRRICAPSDFTGRDLFSCGEVVHGMRDPAGAWHPNKGSGVDCDSRRPCRLRFRNRFWVRLGYRRGLRLRLRSRFRFHDRAWIGRWFGFRFWNYFRIGIWFGLQNCLRFRVCHRLRIGSGLHNFYNGGWGGRLCGGIIWMGKQSGTPNGTSQHHTGYCGGNSFVG